MQLFEETFSKQTYKQCNEVSLRFCLVRNCPTAPITYLANRFGFLPNVLGFCTQFVGKKYSTNKVKKKIFDSNKDVQLLFAICWYFK